MKTLPPPPVSCYLWCRQLSRAAQVETLRLIVGADKEAGICLSFNNCN